MARTKIQKITGFNVEMAKTLGLALESGRTWVILAGTPDEAMAALKAARQQKPAAVSDRGEAEAFATLLRKLVQQKPEYVKVLDDAPAGAFSGTAVLAAAEAAPAPAEEELAPVVALRPEVAEMSDEEAEAVMLADADAAAEAALAAQAEAPAAEEEPAAVVALSAAEVSVAADARAEAKAAKAAKAKPAKAKAEPKRKPLPEGYVTVVGLQHEINRRGLYRGNREDGQLTGQSLYTYIKANKEGSAYPFPIGKIDGQVAIKLEDGIAWWVAKDERVAAKAKARTAKAEEAAAKKTAGQKAGKAGKAGK